MEFLSKSKYLLNLPAGKSGLFSLGRLTEMGGLPAEVHFID